MHDGPCLDCGTPFQGSYCPACGQRHPVTVPGVLDYLRELGQDYITPDGRLWRTLWMLFARPGALLQEYLAGRRQRYIGPVRLYLACSVLFFLVLSLLPAERVGVNVRTEMTPAERAELRAKLDEAPDLVKPLLERLANSGGGEGTDLSRRISERVIDYGPHAMFVLLPVFALMTRLLFYSRRQPFGVHLVLALHAHTVVYLNLLWQMALPAVLAPVLGAYAMVWVLLAFRRVFGGGWPGLLLRYLLAAAGYFVLVTLSTLGSVIVAARSL